MASRNARTPSYTVQYGTQSLTLLQPRALLPLASGGRQHRVVQGERLDLLAWRYYRDPLMAWMIADANGCSHPDELLEPGRLLVIPPDPR